MARKENKKWIIELVERLAREAGHGNVKFHSWKFYEYVDPSELDPNKYTGPAGEVWKLILAEEVAPEPIASIGLTRERDRRVQDSPERNCVHSPARCRR